MLAGKRVERDLDVGADHDMADVELVDRCSLECHSGHCLSTCSQAFSVHAVVSQPFCCKL